MKSRFIVLAPILGATVFLGGHAQAACNARQEFCSYPTWAANAFSPQAQKPRFASGYPETYLAPNITDYGYGPVFAYAPAYGPASAYGYGPANVTVIRRRTVPLRPTAMILRTALRRHTATLRRTPMALSSTLPLGTAMALPTVMRQFVVTLRPMALAVPTAMSPGGRTHVTAAAIGDGRPPAGRSM